MSNPSDPSRGMPADEMENYLQMYLDETGEQLESLVEILLVLETDAASATHIADAFRLVHTLKGSAALMGFDTIAEITHRLENHLERVRSGAHRLDAGLMKLSLRFVDFFRESNSRLRAGQPLAAEPDLLQDLSIYASASSGELKKQAAKPAPITEAPPASKRSWRVQIHLEPGQPLPDLKAQLVIARLAKIGSVLRTLPGEQELAKVEENGRLQVILESDRPADEIRFAADVAGIAFLEIDEGVHEFLPSEAAPDETDSGELESVPALSATMTMPVETPDAKAKVAPTVRVDIERLDQLMNLAGELVVNKARFVQIARHMGPAFKKSTFTFKARAFGESMRRALCDMKAQAAQTQEGGGANWTQHLRELETEMDAIEEQSRLWETSRRYFGQVTEAIDQLSRVSDSIQRGVLGTRMVPVAPLFNRFKRVVRDIGMELNKKVNLEIKGEKTELDKRMIDELGDPLTHLVRNSIDHGIEPADIRQRRGKPEGGTVCLEAAPSGNYVYIFVRDDGGGIDTDKIRRRLSSSGLVAPDLVDGLSEEELIEFIWHPGFSTAQSVSEISGRGVGMDIVRTRIAELNGTIEIKQAAGQGTTFIIRLPLTLAIIRSLLFRVSRGVFAVPIDNVREIMSAPMDQIVTVNHRQTFEVRGEFIPLMDIDDVFDWPTPHAAGSKDAAAKKVNVVILHSSGKTMGLKVNELLGGQDIVIKSLAENFVHIRGLSGASILGDGSVSLLLDVTAAIEMAGRVRPNALRH